MIKRKNRINLSKPLSHPCKRLLLWILTVSVFNHVAVTCGENPLDLPTLTSPLNNSTLALEMSSPSILFEWEEVKQATSYHIQIATQQNFSQNSIIANEIDLSQNFFELHTTTINTSYYWRVRALSRYNESQWTESWTVITSEGL